MEEVLWGSCVFLLGAGYRVAEVSSGVGQLWEERYLNADVWIEYLQKMIVKLSNALGPGDMGAKSSV